MKAQPSSNSLEIVNSMPPKKSRKLPFKSKTLFYGGLFLGALVLALVAPHLSGLYLYLTELVGHIRPPARILSSDLNP